MDEVIKILLIEDDEVDGMFFQRSLSDTGISAQLTIAGDAITGVNEYKNGNFDCVFLDYMLPGTDGLKVLAKLREDPDSSVVLVTSHGDQKIAVEAMKAGALDYISKSSITAESLGHVIRSVQRLRNSKRERITMEQILDHSEKRHRTLFEQSQGFLCTHDLEGNVITVNLAGANSINYTQEQLIGINLKKIITPDTQRLFTHYLKKIRSEKSATGEMKVLTKEGEERIWLYNNSLYEGPTETYVIGSALDITDRVKMEEERLNSKRVEEESAEIKKLAFELNTSSNKIKDSINYAKRLQNGIYRSSDVFKRVFRNSFIIDYPKDIVSGDFYWFNIKNKKRIIALADCTGHGVPGALLSTLGYTMLNTIVLTNNITIPDQILKKLCIDWRKTFDHFNKQNNNNDGMEISLCSIDHENKVLEFSAMGGGMFFMRNEELTEYKGENIGISRNYLKTYTNYDTKNLTLHKIPFKESDRIYLFSDGYRDQFGGSEGNEKFTKKRLKNLIVSIQKHSMEKQKQLIDNAFVEWKGNKVQVDDVLVIGVQL